jgi:transcriptional regulator with XRE-family HTH domain
MSQGTSGTRQGTRRAATRGGGAGGAGVRGARGAGGDELMQAKLEIVSARERGEQGTLVRLLQSYPRYALELTEFSAALVATSSYEHEALTAETEAIAARASARALAAVFPVVPAKAAKATPALATLKALRQARGLTIKVVAQRLGLGPDVLSGLEAGVIRAASVPERLLRLLSETLDATAEQVQMALQTQAAVAPALLRSTQGATRDEAGQPELDFAEAVQLSPSMTDEQKARWLTE